MKAYVILHKGFTKINIVKIFSDIEVARDWIEGRNENWWIEEHEIEGIKKG